MCEPYKRFSDLSADNPKGLEPLESPHNFSNNPGQIAGRVPMSGPSVGMQAPRNPTHTSSVIHPPTFSAVGSGNTVGRSANRGFGSISNPAPGSTDPTSDGGPLTMTSGFGG
jgi:hypothetical protein